MGETVRAFRGAARSLIRSPGFSVPALLILALGMTAATSVFTVVDSIVFRPLDLPESHRLVLVCEDHPRLEGLCIASPGQTEDLRGASGALVELGIGRTWQYVLTDAGGSGGVSGGLATAGFLRALGVQPALGRLFTDEEHGPDDDRVVLLGHALWTTRFGRDPSVLGASVTLDGVPHTVVGVLPSGFEAPFDMASVDLWKPPHFDPLDPEVREWRGFRAVGRLAPGVSLEAARSELEAAYGGLARLHPDVVGPEWRLRVTPLLDVVVGDTRPVLLAFLAASGLLLLLVCANVANLLLARGLGRRAELSVRAALGAGRARLVGGILVESLTLTAAATLLALVGGAGVTRLLVRLAPPEIPRLDEVAMDGRVLIFAALLSVAATATFALVPALRVTAGDLGRSMRARGGETRGTRLLTGGLVAAELALGVVLLASAVLLTRAFAATMAWDPGFQREGLLTVGAFASPGRYPDRDDVQDLWRRAEEAVAALPGVAAVSTASAGPLFGGGDGATPFAVAGTDPAEALPSASWYDVGPGYFATLGLPLVEGRGIEEADLSGGAPVALVNQTMARRGWPGGTAVGETVHLPEQERTFEVVGVVADVPPLVPGEATRPEIYWSDRQFGRWATFLVVRARGDPVSLAGPVTDALAALDPELSLGTPRTLLSQERRLLVRPRFQALVLLAFALAALALAGVGVYAVVAYSVARRFREMGIRVALGARGGEVVGLVVRSTLATTAAGIGVGWAGSLGVARLLAGAIPGVDARDVASSTGAAAVLLAAALLAAWLPARRATRADPLGALRQG